MVDAYRFMAFHLKTQGIWSIKLGYESFSRSCRLIFIAFKFEETRERNCEKAVVRL